MLDPGRSRRSMLGFRTNEPHPRSAIKQQTLSSNFLLSLLSSPLCPLHHRRRLTSMTCQTTSLCHPYQSKIWQRYPTPPSTTADNLHSTLPVVPSIGICSKRTKHRIVKDAHVQRLNSRKSSGSCTTATPTRPKRSERTWVIGSECK